MKFITLNRASTLSVGLSWPGFRLVKQQWRSTIRA